MIGAAVRPVDLIEVDVIRLQAREAGIYRLADGARIDIAPAANIVTPGTGDLGGEHNLVTLAGLFEPCADIVFRPSLRFGGNGGGGVKLGRIEEIDAVLQRVIHLRMRFGFSVLRAPRHCAKANFGHGNARAAQ